MVIYDNENKNKTNNENTKPITCAQRYATLGLAILPIHSATEDGQCTCRSKTCTSVGKHPRNWNGVKGATTCDGILSRYFPAPITNINMAVATGKASGVVVIGVDVDGDANGIEDVKRFEHANSPIPTTWIASTPRGGRHYYFRYDDRCKSLKNAVKVNGHPIDVRCNGGYVILPPSRGPQGEYVWINSPDDTPLADMPDWLFDLLPKRDGTTSTTPTTEDVMTGVGPKVVETTNTDTTTADVMTGPDPDPDAPKPKTSIVVVDEHVIRLRAYLANTPPAVSGENGHGHTCATICRIVEIFGLLDDATIVDELTGWNNRCSPPWTDSELRHKLADARRRVNVHPDNVSDDEDEPTATVVDSVSTSTSKTKTRIAKRKTLNEDAYHGLAGDVVRRLEPQSECDPVALLLTLLVGVGAHVGRHPYFLVESTKHHANLFVTIVGKSSKARKGTSLDRITSLLPQGRIRNLSGLSSGEGLIESVKDREDGLVPRLTLPLMNEKQVLVVESEFARCLKVMKRQDSTLSAILRDAWDGKTLSVMTRNPITATDAHISIVSHVTMQELAATMTDSDIYNGFANRFLWGIVSRARSLPLGSDVVNVDDLKQRLADAIDKAKTIGRMAWSPECRELWSSVYDTLSGEREVAPNEIVYDAVTSRAEAQVLRLSMIYALLDGSHTIDVPHLKAALAVWDYCDESAKTIFVNEQATTSTFEQSILKRLRSSPNGCNRTDLWTSRRKTPEQLTQAINRLIDRGDIVVADVGGKDRYFAVEQSASNVVETTKTKTKTEADDVDPSARAVVGSTKTTTATTTETTTTTATATATEANTSSLTFSELMTWKNEHAVRFTRRDDGTIWVTSEHEQLVTPAIAESLKNYADLVDLWAPVAVVNDVKTEDVDVAMTNEEFLAILRAM